jgi:hypothetical protein
MPPLRRGDGAGGVALRRIVPRRLGGSPSEMSTGAQYVVAAYAIVLFALLVYVLVLGLRAARIARDAELLARLVEAGGAAAPEERAGQGAEAEVSGSTQSAGA